MIASKGGASEPADTLRLGKAGGTAAVRRTLASTIRRATGPTQVARPRQLRDASTVMRFQPAHQSMINRRHDGRASCPAQRSPKHPLERKPRIYLPDTCKGGHESGENQTEDSGPNGRNLRSTVDPAGSIRLILSTSGYRSHRYHTPPSKKTPTRSAQRGGYELSDVLRQFIGPARHQPARLDEREPGNDPAMFLPARRGIPPESSLDFEPGAQLEIASVGGDLRCRARASASTGPRVGGATGRRR